MIKVKQSNKNITPFGGLNFIYQAMNKLGLNQFINNALGSRNAMAKYEYSDILYSLFGNVLTQGEFIADIEKFREKFTGQVFQQIPSADTVEYVCQELKMPNIIETTSQGVVHQINYDNNMNKTLVKLAVKTNQLNSQSGYTLDYDNIIIGNDKQDALYSYKKVKGYHPGIAFIGRIPVHIENHNGNTPAKYEQTQILQRCFSNLQEENIKLEHFRADSASYQKTVIELATHYAENIYIRVVDCLLFQKACGKAKTWETIEVNSEIKEVASIVYKPFKGSIEYRVVVTRKKRKDKQIDLFSKDAYTYYGIMTTNENMTEKEIIEFYNKRGDDENSNRYLLNDFNLHHLPFPDMDTNTVYMYLMAMCNTLFEWVKEVLVKNKTPNITIKLRIKAVCFNYITVATKFINHAKETIIQVFSPSEYCILQV